jgi:hypothetical protein
LREVGLFADTCPADTRHSVQSSHPNAFSLFANLAYPHVFISTMREAFGIPSDLQDQESWACAIHLYFLAASRKQIQSPQTEPAGGRTLPQSYDPQENADR